MDLYVQNSLPVNAQGPMVVPRFVHTQGSNVGRRAPLIEWPQAAMILTRNAAQPGGGIHPTSIALFGTDSHDMPHSVAQQLLAQMNMPPTYMGRRLRAQNHSVPGLSDHLNCSFWLTRLPADVTIKEIADSIRACGRVYHIRIISGYGHSRGAAAIVTFFNSSATMAFLDGHVFGAQVYLRVRGRMVSVVRNRIKIPPQLDLPIDHTRVIRIAGPVEIVNYQFLTTHFESFCKYELEDVLDHSITPGHGDLEFRFARYDSQAECVFHALERDTLFAHNPLVTVHFAADPCAQLGFALSALVIIIRSLAIVWPGLTAAFMGCMGPRSGLDADVLRNR